MKGTGPRGVSGGDKIAGATVSLSPVTSASSKPEKASAGCRDRVVKKELYTRVVIFMYLLLVGCKNGNVMGLEVVRKMVYNKG